MQREGGLIVQTYKYKPKTNSTLTISSSKELKKLIDIT